MAGSALNIGVRKPGFLGAEEAMLDLSDATQPLDLKNGVVYAPRCFQPATIGH